MKASIIILFLIFFHFNSQNDVEHIFLFNQFGDTDFQSMLKDKKIIFIGEIHGTNEVPAFVHHLVKSLRVNGCEVEIGLEINEDYQGDIDSFLKTGNKQIIENSEFFNSNIKDGRSSIALSSLIYILRKTKDIRIFCFDASKKTKVSSIEERDSIMAENIRKNLSEKLTIVLTGNIHAKQNKGFSSYTNFKPAAYLLKNKYNLCDSIISFNCYFGGGMAWNCMSDSCGEHSVGFNAVLSKRHNKQDVLVIHQHIDKLGYNGYIYFNKASTSRPLKL